MRIALVISTARPGGAEGQLTRLAAELAARGHKVTVYFLAAGGPLTTVLDEAGVPWKVFVAISPDTSKLDKLRELLAFARSVRAERLDIVYAWLPGVIWLALPVASLVSGARRVAAFRGLVQAFEVRSRLRRAVFRMALSRAHAVTANAPWLEQEAVRWGARADRVRFMPNGVDVPGPCAEPARVPPRAVVVANFFAYKRHESVVRAISEVPGVNVLFVGSGDLLDATRTLAGDLGVAERIEFVEDCAVVSPLLLSCQFAIHPSSTEGMSNAVLEEMAHGLPVVALDVGANAMLVEDGVSGFIVPADDPAALVERIARLAGSPELRSWMGAAARSAAQRYSWPVSVESNERLFDGIRAGPSTRHGATTRD